MTVEEATAPEKVTAATPERPEAHSEAFVLAVDFAPLAELIAAAVLERIGDEVVANPSPWLDVGAAAAHLSCCPERLRKLVSRREAPFHQSRPGGRLFFHRRELDDWLLSQ